jgi:hypothetical protein
MSNTWDELKWGQVQDNSEIVELIISNFPPKIIIAWFSSSVLVVGPCSSTGLTMISWITSSSVVYWLYQLTVLTMIWLTPTWHSFDNDMIDPYLTQFWQWYDWLLPDTVLTMIWLAPTWHSFDNDMTGSYLTQFWQWYDWPLPDTVLTMMPWSAPSSVSLSDSLSIVPWNILPKVPT